MSAQERLLCELFDGGLGQPNYEVPECYYCPGHGTSVRTVSEGTKNFCDVPPRLFSADQLLRSPNPACRALASQATARVVSQPSVAISIPTQQSYQQPPAAVRVVQPSYQQPPPVVTVGPTRTIQPSYQQPPPAVRTTPSASAPAAEYRPSVVYRESAMTSDPNPYGLSIEGRYLGSFASLEEASRLAAESALPGDRFEILYKGASTGLRVMTSAGAIRVPRESETEVRAMTATQVKDFIAGASETAAEETEIKKSGFPWWLLAVPVVAVTALKTS
jgi:hypothetical protein